MSGAAGHADPSKRTIALLIAPLALVGAKAAEARRDRAMAAYHQYELASASVQIAIVLASAAITTSATVLVWVAGGLGLLGVVMSAVGFFAPTAVHRF